MDKQIVVYKASDGGELSVRTDGETIWMTIDQMVRLFGRDRTVLVRHVNNAIKEGELRRDINVQNLHNIQGGRGRPRRPILHAVQSASVCAMMIEEFSCISNF